MKFLFLCTLLISSVIVSAIIEGTEDSFKPERYIPVGYPVIVDGYLDVKSKINENNEELEELPVPSRATVFHGRFRRAIRDPIAEFLDDKAAEAVFNDIHPPAPPKFSDFESSQEGFAGGEISSKGTTASQSSSSASSVGDLPQGPPFSSSSGSAWENSPSNLRASFDSPFEEPRARGLVNIPDGWNLNRPIDIEYRNRVLWNLSSRSHSMRHRREGLGIQRYSRNSFSQVRQRVHSGI